MLGALRYIHNNPVKARICKNAFDYRWSSAKDFINKNATIIDNNYIDEIFSLFNKNDFIQFHSLSDDNLYIDTKEEESSNIEEIVQNAIDKYTTKYGIIDQKQVSQNQKEEIAINLLRLNIITNKEIANLCNLNPHRVSKLNSESNKSTIT